MKYFDTISAVTTLFQWKETIMEILGPYPTEDSELLLSHMVEEIIEVNKDMKTFKKNMMEMIYCRSLNLIYFNCDWDNNSYLDFNDSDQKESQ